MRVGWGQVRGPKDMQSERSRAVRGAHDPR